MGRVLLTTAIAVLAVFSNGGVARWLAGSLEWQCAPMPDDVRTQVANEPASTVRYISVLGGGHSEIPDWSSNNKLNVHALARIVEGVRLAHALPGAKLIVSGASGDHGRSDAEIMKQAAVALGISPDRIVQLDSPRDTMEEAVAVKTVVHDDLTVVVTSAVHAPRAIALMRHQGVRAIPAPVDFLIRGRDVRLRDCFWGSLPLDANTAALHERLGLLWARLRGKI